MNIEVIRGEAEWQRAGAYSVRIQGMNRQIRRMCEYLEYRVVALKRVRVMNILLGDLPSGKYREITPKELAELRKML